MSDLVVASTTDSIEEINAAAGIKEPVEKAEEPEQVEAAAEQPEKPEQKPGKSGFQKRIDKLTREKYETKQQLDAVLERLEKLEQGKVQVAEPEQVEVKEPASGKPEKPDPKNFDDWDKYEAAKDDYYEKLAEWKAEQKLVERDNKRKEEEVRTAQEQQASEALNAFAERIEEAAEKYDDWDEVSDTMKNEPELPVVVTNAIIDTENGPDVMYYLATHKDVRKKLYTMSDERAAVEIGRISAILEQPEVEEEEKRPIKELPAPIRPLRGSSTKSTVPIDELPYQEYAKIRAKQEKERYRR